MHKIKNAFTLIELSAVIAIIGILIAGLMGATGLVKKSKIAAAQSLTSADAAIAHSQGTGNVYNSNVST